MLLLILNCWWLSDMLERHTSCLLEHFRSLKHKGGVSSLESRRQINIFRNDTPIQQTQHSIRYIIFCDGRWISEWIISEILWQDSLRMSHLFPLDLADTQSLKLVVTDCSLSSTVFDVIRLGQGILVSEKVMTY